MLDVSADALARADGIAVDGDGAANFARVHTARQNVQQRRLPAAYTRPSLTRTSRTQVYAC
jgi:hypothetical protein